MRGALYPEDHAFADGPVFGRVDSPRAAKQAMANFAGDIPKDYAQKLFDIWSRFSSGARVGEGVLLGMGARLINGDKPENVVIEGPSAIRGCVRNETGGKIRIGQFVYIGDNVILSAHQEISVGEATLLAHGVQIFDNDSHPTNAYQREIQFRRMLGDKRVFVPLEIGKAPVRIGKRCWIGLNSLVLKGVTIGDNTIVAANSVVTASLPANTLAAGNPARVVRELRPEEIEAASPARS